MKVAFLYPPSAARCPNAGLTPSATAASHPGLSSAAHPGLSTASHPGLTAATHAGLQVRTAGLTDAQEAAAQAWATALHAVSDNYSPVSFVHHTPLY